MSEMLVRFSGNTKSHVFNLLYGTILVSRVLLNSQYGKSFYLMLREFYSCFFFFLHPKQYTKE